MTKCVFSLIFVKKIKKCKKLFTFYILYDIMYKNKFCNSHINIIKYYFIERTSCVMNNGNRRRKRYRVRYDRLIMVGLIFLVIIFIFASCANSCSKKKDKKDNKKPSSSVIDQTSVPDNQGANQGNNIQQGDPGGQTPIMPATATEYTTSPIEYSLINSGDLVLVNSQYEYKFPANDIKLVDVYSNRNDCYSVSDMNVSLDVNVIARINDMMSNYYEAVQNNYLRVIAGHRTIEVQNDKYKNGISNIAGGYSDYHTGRSFKLGIFPKGESSNVYKPEGQYAWIDQNCANYGFILRYPEGKDAYTGDESSTAIFRYVGIPHAVYMKENNLCLEEYIEAIKAYNYNNTLKVVSGTQQYEVYYVAANVNNVTDVPVPSNKTYSVSGNNVDGFIITVSQ